MSADDSDRLARLMGRHQALHDPAVEPRNQSPWLAELRRWQSARPKRSYGRFLHHPRRRPAAGFFLTDVYGERDFSRRDSDIARVLPMMRRLLPDKLLGTVADAIELGVGTQTLARSMDDVRQRLALRRRRLDEALYAEAYRQVGDQAARARQIALIGKVGRGFGKALKLPGVAALLAFSRGPAKLAGLSELQGFLERGFGAFETLGDVEDFIREIELEESGLSQRLFAGAPAAFEAA